MNTLWNPSSTDVQGVALSYGPKKRPFYLKLFGMIIAGYSRIFDDGGFLKNGLRTDGTIRRLLLNKSVHINVECCSESYNQAILFDIVTGTVGNRIGNEGILP